MPVYPRHRIDITWADLGYALGACLWARDRVRLAGELERQVSPPDDAVVHLSVRSGFDLLLTTLDFPPGSEVLVSAITHPDMIGILELHRLRPVPIDLDVQTLEPRRDLLAAAVTPRTRMILVAHLFGASVDLQAAVAVAQQEGLLMVEDCAQALVDARAHGDPLTDVSMFSFGPIKTSAALGGAILRIRDADLRERMRTAVASWPVQRRSEFFRRALKFSVLQLLAHATPFGFFVRTCALIGRDLDAVLSAFVRGFKTSYDDPAFLERIRRQPCAPLLALLLRRLRRFDSSRIQRRAWVGEELARSLPAGATCPGQAAAHRTHWLLPVVPDDPAALITALRSRGFDAAPASATSAITVVAAPPERPELRPVAAESLLARAVFLPCYPHLPDRAVRKLVEAVQASM